MRRASARVQGAVCGVGLFGLLFLCAWQMSVVAGNETSAPRFSLSPVAHGRLHRGAAGPTDEHALVANQRARVPPPRMCRLDKIAGSPLALYQVRKISLTLGELLKAPLNRSESAQAVPFPGLGARRTGCVALGLLRTAGLDPSTSVSACKAAFLINLKQPLTKTLRTILAAARTGRPPGRRSSSTRRRRSGPGRWG